MEPNKHSCASRMRCCGIPAEKACFIFSIINAIIVSTSLAACIYYIGWIIRIKVNRHYDDGLELALNIIFCAVLSVCTGISFIFAVLLCHGAHKKKPAFLMTYFVYGILVEIASVGAAIAFLITTYQHEDPNVEQAVVGSVALILCAVYAFPLTLVFRAYVVLSNNTVLPSGHAKLMNHYPVL